MTVTRNEAAAWITALAYSREHPENTVYALAWYGCKVAGIPSSELTLAQRQQWAFETYADNVRMGDIGEKPHRHIESEPFPEETPVPEKVPATPEKVPA